MVVGGHRHSRQLYTLKRVPVPIVEKAGWEPGPVWTIVGKKKIVPTRFRTQAWLSPYRVAIQTTLFRLHLSDIQIYNCKAPNTEGTLAHSAITFLVFLYLFIILGKTFQIVHCFKIPIISLTMKAAVI
jgi:hypothetical protein